MSPSQWRRYNSKFSNFGISVPADWIEPREVSGSLHTIGDYSGKSQGVDDPILQRFMFHVNNCFVLQLSEQH